jgi:hypothetical protein
MNAITDRHDWIVAATSKSARAVSDRLKFVSQANRRHRKKSSVEYVRPGEIYSEPEVDLQLPKSHLAFRLPAGFNGRLAANETFKIFSADRDLSCFVFIHGLDAPLPVNWMSAEFTLEGETLVATGELKHAQSDLIYRLFEGDKILCYKFEKTNRRGAGLHGSAAALKTDADRLMTFLKPFLSSFHRGVPGFASAASTPAPPPVPASPPTPPPQPAPQPAPAPIITRDRRLHGLWYYSPPVLRSGRDSMVTFRFRYFAYDGRFAQGGESYATFVRRSSDGSWAGIDMLRSKVPPGDRGTWETNGGILTLHYDDEMASDFSYYVEGNSMLLSQPGRERQLWTRG